MTQIEALAAMKRKAKVLSEFFTDEELTAFLEDRKITDEIPNPLPVDWVQTYTYDLRPSIYDALTSALTVAEQSTTRGGVSVTYADLFKIRKQFATASTISLVGRRYHACADIARY